ncbi:hypothetical protein GW17_00053850 [Ensete ventricosum]|nr:hypothetical protein GW17_00053850 [Ensete ventricosum]RZR94189.1 hypothetical protein BHM03_00022843 [Ensete ventricosum]
MAHRTLRGRSAPVRTAWLLLSYCGRKKGNSLYYFLLRAWHANHRRPSGEPPEDDDRWKQRMSMVRCTDVAVDREERWTTDEESMLRAEWVDALVNDVVLEIDDISASSYDDELAWPSACGSGHRLMVFQEEKGLAWISHQWPPAVTEVATEASVPSSAMACML